MSTGWIIALGVVAVAAGLAVYFKVFERIADWWRRASVFVKETRAELAKVTFPSREDVIATTIVVLIASFVFAIFLVLSDVVVNKAYSFVFDILGA